MKNQIEIKGKKSLFSFLAVVIGSLMLIITLFMPFASATEDKKEYLQKHSDDMYVEELEMTNEDVINISLLEFGKIYSVAAEIGMSESTSIACLVIISVFGLFAVLTLVFSILKKAVTVLIFNLLAFGMFQIIKWDFEDRGVIPNDSYDWGMAQYFCYIGAVVVVVGTVALLMGKINEKKQ